MSRLSMELKVMPGCTKELDILFLLLMKLQTILPVNFARLEVHMY